MSFFNKKEDVIDIQLTSYGKRKLMEGKFNPTYYAFEDSEVIYDYDYTGVEEGQNDAQERIKDNIRVKTNPIVEGVETNVLNMNRYYRVTGKQEIKDNNNNYYLTLGNSKISSQYCPAWNIKYLKGQITGSNYYITGSYQLYKIPRLESILNYTSYVDITDIPDSSEEERPPSIEPGTSRIFSDGSYILTEEDFLLLEINEDNVDFTLENFDIEVNILGSREMSKISSSFYEETPLYFVSVEEETSMTDMILKSEQELKSDNVEYYFDFLVDNEIDDSVMCEYLVKETKKNVFSDNPYQCNVNKIQERDIYETTVEDIDEECD